MSETRPEMTNVERRLSVENALQLVTLGCIAGSSLLFYPTIHDRIILGSGCLVWSGYLFTRAGRGLSRKLTWRLGGVLFIVVALLMPFDPKVQWILLKMALASLAIVLALRVCTEILNPVSGEVTDAVQDSSEAPAKERAALHLEGTGI